mmetsp:Transcript_53788/g.173743  ORF Transcript_53788/g.173743 Transcript_53788/m.173743 type:complete len:385 (-) Transcript_53788:344-1498(-)
MIYYRQDTWREQIFRFSGTIWPSIWRKQVLMTIYTIASYVFCEKMGGNLGKFKGNFLGGILSFLLVFRTSQSYARYWQGRSLLTGFFCDLREIVILSMTLMPGGARGYQWRWKTSRKGTSTGEKSREMVQSLESFTDDSDRIMSEERVDILRWAFVVAIAFQAHARMVYSLEHGDLPSEIQKLVDWDRFRIRCLTTKAEFRDLDRLVSGTAIPQAAWEDSLLLDPKGFLKEMEEDFFSGPRRRQHRGVRGAGPATAGGRDLPAHAGPLPQRERPAAAGQALRHGRALLLGHGQPDATVEQDLEHSGSDCLHTLAFPVFPLVQVLALCVLIVFPLLHRHLVGHLGQLRGVVLLNDRAPRFGLHRDGVGKPIRLRLQRLVHSRRHT